MKKLVLSIATAMLAQTAAAETTTFSCTMTKQDSHGWIGRHYAFQVDAEDGWAKVADRPEWLDTQFKDRGKKGYRMVWYETQRATAGGNLRVRYQANLNPEEKSVKVRMAFVSTNAANKPFGVGTCNAEK